MQIRTAVDTDHEDIVHLLGGLLEDRLAPAEAYVKPLAQLLTGDRGTVLVAEENGELYGLITISFVLALRYTGDYAQIEELIVDPRARGKKLGVGLVKAAIEAARSADCHEIGLYAREHNQPFYERLGFEYAGPELRLKLV